MKKQVILVMVDTQRTDMLGCYGNQDMVTPNLDKLAEKGLRYTKAMTCQPVCGPARSTIFTGLYPQQTGVTGNCIGMGDNIKTIGQRLTDNGFRCGYIGKWHLDGADYFGNGMCPEGFDPDYWYDMRMFVEEFSEEDRLRSRKPTTSYDEDWPAENTYVHRCADRAIKFLDNHADEDFYLTLSIDEPHFPYISPAPYNRMYDNYKMPYNENFNDDLSEKTLMQRLWADKDLSKSAEELNVASQKLALYLGCNSFVDAEIGRFLDKVYEQCPDALIIYTADHGDMLGNHHLMSKNCAIYKEVAQIPFIITGGAQGVIDDPTSHINIVPTILEHMGIAHPKLLPGKSLLPQVKDGKTKINDHVFVEFTRVENNLDGQCGYQPMRGIFDGRYKLAVNLMDHDELYDTASDPDEMVNLIDDPSYHEIKIRLHDLILKNMDDTRDVSRGYQWAVRPWRDDKKPSKFNSGFVRQRENEEYEPRQLDYETGLPMTAAVRDKTNYAGG